MDPGALLGGEMKDVWVGWITQECPPLHPTLQCLGNKGQLAPGGDEATYLQAPVGIEVIDDPIIALHRGQLAHDLGQMGRKILAGPGATEMAHQLPCWHHERGDQGPYPMADVLVLTFFRLPRLGDVWGIFPLQNLHARLVVRTDDQPTWFIETE